MHLHSFNTLQDHPGTVVIPDGGAQAALTTALDYAASRRGAASWHAQVVTGQSAYLRQQFMSGMLAAGNDADASGNDIAFVLTPEQERAVWERVIDGDTRIDAGAPDQIARLAADAWRVAHGWRLDINAADTFLTPDVAAFRRWSAAYMERTGQLNVIEPARLLNHAASIATTTAKLAHGFIDPSPAQLDWLARLAAPPAADARAPLSKYTAHAAGDRAAELREALTWAAATAATDTHARIAVVIDTLATEREVVQRACDDVFAPQALGAPVADYYLSQRPALAAVPLLDFALSLLGIEPLAQWDTVSKLILNPLLAGAQQEGAARACFDAELRALERFEIPLPFALNQLAENHACARLRQLLADLVTAHDDLPQTQRLSAWLVHFDECLRRAGWLEEAQADPLMPVWLNAWGNCCDRLHALDAVLPPVSRHEALARLRRQVQDSMIPAPQPQHGIYLVPAREAMVIAPTHVWITGCASEALLEHSRLSPLLPLDLQRSAGVPGSDPRTDLWRARVMLETLAAGAREAHASFAVSDGESPLSPSPLLPALAALEPASAAAFVPKAWRQTPAQIDTIYDDIGPQLPAGADLAGGTAALSAQAACPFRAFARFRLRSDPVVDPQPGISPRHKGIMVHRILARLWDELGDNATLQAMAADERGERISTAINRELTALPFETRIERELFFIERERLNALLARWLEFEAGRAAFTVIARELKVETEFAGRRFSTRLDRADKLADGRVVIVDYKTGRTSTSQWDPPRARDPQLPFYALTAPFENVAAIAFAEVDVAEPQWRQFPDDSQPEDAGLWPEELAAWRDDLTALIGEIGAGYALPDPRDGAQTCRYCDQALFCRRVEIVADSAAEAGDTDAASGDE